MGNPKFQDPDNASTKLEFPDTALPSTPGSSNFTKDVDRFLARHRIESDGLLVASYVRDSRRQWRMRWRAAPESFFFHATNDTLETFHQLQVFDFYPDKDVSTHYLVEWVQPKDYLPILIPGANRYDFEILIREAVESI